MSNQSSRKIIFVKFKSLSKNYNGCDFENLEIGKNGKTEIEEKSD